MPNTQAKAPNRVATPVELLHIVCASGSQYDIAVAPPFVVSSGDKSHAESLVRSPCGAPPRESRTPQSIPRQCGGRHTVE